MPSVELDEPLDPGPDASLDDELAPASHLPSAQATGLLLLEGLDARHLPMAVRLLSCFMGVLKAAPGALKAFTEPESRSRVDATGWGVHPSTCGDEDRNDRPEGR